MFIDTHAHLYLPDFEPVLEEILERTISKTAAVYLPNIDLESIEPMLRLHLRQPDKFFPMLGLHPCSVKADFKKVLKVLENRLLEPHWVGIGEAGTDLYWDKTFWPEQKSALEIQLDWAKETQKPIILHCRSSLDETIEIVKKSQDGRLFGIFHCFGGSLKQAQQIIDLNFWLGIGGVVTYKNATLPEVLKKIPLSRVVLETDSPYLAPVPLRGKLNEPANLTYIAEKLSLIYETELQAIAEVTSGNACNVFKKN